MQTAPPTQTVTTIPATNQPPPPDITIVVLHI